MLEILAPFTIGLIGSLHCLGMCGPLVLAYSLRCKKTASAPGAAFLQHAAFHSGRIVSYGTLGAIVAALFGSIEVQRFSMQYRGGFAIFSGILLLALGLALLRVFPIPAVLVRLLSPPPSFQAKMGRLANSGSTASSIALGLAAGLIPCGLTWAMLVAAASTLSPARGLLTMISFGAGTTPLLFAAGLSASFLSLKARMLGEKAAAASVMLMGVLLIVKGAGTVCGWGDHCGGIEILWKNGLLQ